MMFISHYFFKISLDLVKMTLFANYYFQAIIKGVSGIILTLLLKTIIMYSLLKGLWEYFFRKDEYFVVILGLDNAGKTVN